MDNNQKIKNFENKIDNVLGITEAENTDSTRFIQDENIDRSTMLSAMKNSGHSASSLAKAVDVDVSTISRLLRKPNTKDPDESARNPSVTLLSKIAKELSSDPSALFGDIFK